MLVHWNGITCFSVTSLHTRTRGSVDVPMITRPRRMEYHLFDSSTSRPSPRYLDYYEETDSPLTRHRHEDPRSERSWNYQQAFPHTRRFVPPFQEGLTTSSDSLEYNDNENIPTKTAIDSLKLNVYSSFIRSASSTLIKLAIISTVLILMFPPSLPAEAFANKITTAYDDRPKRRGPTPTDLGVAIRQDLVGDEYRGLKHCGIAPNCFCSTDALEDDPDHSIPPWHWPRDKDMKQEEAFELLYQLISKEYIPGQGNIDGGGFEVKKYDPKLGYLYVQFESLKNGYIDDVEFAYISPITSSASSMNDDSSWNTIQVRSSSRVGYLDYGVNAKRLNFIAQLLQKRGWDAPGVDLQTHYRYKEENNL